MKTISGVCDWGVGWGGETENNSKNMELTNDITAVIDLMAHLINAVTIKKQFGFTVKNQSNHQHPSILSKFRILLLQCT